MPATVVMRDLIIAANLLLAETNGGAEAILTLPHQGLRSFFPALAQERAPTDSTSFPIPCGRHVPCAGTFEESGMALPRCGCASVSRAYPGCRYGVGYITSRSG
jgi:hypothetical protein